MTQTNGGDIPPEQWLTFTGIHGNISQKIATTVRTSNPTYLVA
jgi:hypothetical protein